MNCWRLLKKSRAVMVAARLPCTMTWAPVVGFGLQQHRVHVNGCGLPGGAGLQGLGPADLAAIAGDGGIVGHVLRLEGHDLQPAIGEGAAEAGGDQGFADIGAGAHEHEGAGLHGASHMIWA